MPPRPSATMRGMRFRPRFSLPTLFVLIALASIPMGWVAYQLNWIRQRHDALSGRKMYGVKEIIISGFPIPQPRTAPWSLRLFGEDGYEDFMLDLPEDDPELSRIRALFPEAHIKSK